MVNERNVDHGSHEGTENINERGGIGEILSKVPLSSSSSSSPRLRGPINSVAARGRSRALAREIR